MFKQPAYFKETDSITGTTPGQHTPCHYYGQFAGRPDLTDALQHLNQWPGNMQVFREDLVHIPVNVK
jgi:hypothetical protein